MPLFLLTDLSTGKCNSYLVVVLQKKLVKPKR